jgi:hypothetical protein
VKKEAATVSNILMPSIEELNYKIKVALMWLCKNDHFLIENFANERSTTHKFAEYIQFPFPEWNVDCKYNRRVKGVPKDLLNQDTSYPEVIIHLRNTKCNLLVSEAKSIYSTDHSDEEDKDKIKAYVESPEYHYQVGLWIYFYRKIEEAKLHWFINQNEQCVPWQQNVQSNIKTLRMEFLND